MLKDTLGCMWVGAADLSDTWTQIKILTGLARGSSRSVYQKLDLVTGVVLGMLSTSYSTLSRVHLLYQTVR